MLRRKKNLVFPQLVGASDFQSLALGFMVILQLVFLTTWMENMKPLYTCLLFVFSPHERQEYLIFCNTRSHRMPRIWTEFSFHFSPFDNSNKYKLSEVDYIKSCAKAKKDFFRLLSVYETEFKILLRCLKEVFFVSEYKIGSCSLAHSFTFSDMWICKRFDYQRKKRNRDAWNVDVLVVANANN